MTNMEAWFNELDAQTKEPMAFGFDDGVTEAILTDVSLFESKTSPWTAVQMTFTDADGNTDSGYRVSVSKKKMDGGKVPAKMWQRNVFQLMQPLLMASNHYKNVIDLNTINQGNAAVVEALQIIVDKLNVRLNKKTPKTDDGFAEYKFLKVGEANDNFPFAD